MKRRPLLLAGALCVAFAGVAWTIAWFQIADGIRGRIESWATARRAEGLTAQHAGIAIDGFPFAWRVRIMEPVLTGAGAAAWAWQGEALEARFAATGYRNVRLRFPGEHRLAAGAGALAGMWRVSAARPDGHVLLGADGRLDRLELDFGDTTFVRLPDEKPFRAARLQGAATLPRVAALDHRTETFVLTLLADSLSPIDPPVASLGSTVASTRLDLSFKGRLPTGNFADALRRWRDDGGTIDVNHMAIRWGPIDAEGSGTLALDAQDRPLGAFAARWRGYNETIDALQAAGQIPPWPAAGAKIALNAIARQQPDGTRQVEIPVTLQDGRVYVAGFPVMRLAPLRLD